MIKRSNAKEYTKNFTDVNYFTDPYEDIEFVDDNFIVLAENENLFTTIFQTPVNILIIIIFIYIEN